MSINCVVQHNSEPRLSPDKSKQKADKGNEPRAGADVGKIVNLMASDANRVSEMSIASCPMTLTQTHRYP